MSTVRYCDDVGVALLTSVSCNGHVLSLEKLKVEESIKFICPCCKKITNTEHIDTKNVFMYDTNSPCIHCLFDLDTGNI